MSTKQCEEKLKDKGVRPTVARINTVAFDKTGTLTTGRFDVTDMQAHGIPGPEVLALLLSVEQKSTHPIAQAIVRYAKKQNVSAANISEMHEIAGHGAEAVISGQEVLVGNIRLMKERGISIPEELSDKVATVVCRQLRNMPAICYCPIR